MESIIHDVHGLLDLVRSGKIEPITMWKYYVSQWDEEEQRIFLLKLIAMSKNEKEEGRQESDVDKWASYHASYLSRKINGQHNNKERNSNDITTAENDINGKPIYKLQNQNPSRRNRGRPKETLKDKMINDADGSKLQKVHTIMDGKTGKDAALIVLACIKKGWMTKPTFTQVTEEFGDIGTQQNFTKYLYEKWFTKDEIEGAINSLD